MIPAYNEENKIKATLEDVIIKTNEKKRFSYEIIVVDDGSEDKTTKKVEEVQKELENQDLKLIKFKKNKGKGKAVKRGVLEANGKIVMYMDADNATTIDHLFNFLPYLKDYDIAIGSRTLKNSKIIKRQPIYRIIAGRMGGLLIKLFLGLNQKDTQCGFKIFSKEATEIIFPKIKCNGWGFDFEVLKIAKNQNLKVVELPVEWKNSSDSKVNFKGLCETIGELIFVWKKY